MQVGSHFSQASGWVGPNSLRVNVDRQEHSVRVDGTLGMSNVRLEERDEVVRGTISGFNGIADVNVRVRRGADGSSLCSGWVGRENFYLESRPQGNRQVMRGNWGSHRIDLDRTQNEGYVDISGWVSPPGGFSESVNVHVHSAQSMTQASLECLYPLLGLAAVAVRASEAA